MLTLKNSLVTAAMLVGVTLAPTRAADDPFRPPAITTEDVPALPAELIERLRQYQSVRAAFFRGWAPDGRGILVQTRFGDTLQLHRVYEPGGRREQVSFYREPADGQFLPGNDADTLLVTMGAGGNEQYQIYRHDLGTGRATLLTDGRSRNILGPVADDGGFFLFVSNARNLRDMDLMFTRPDGAAPPQTLMTVNAESWDPLDLSSDGRRAILRHYVSVSDSHPALFDLPSRQLIPIPRPEGHDAGKAAYGDLAFSSDGRSVFGSTDVRGEFLELARVDLASLQYHWLSAHIPWSVDAIKVDRRHGRVAVTFNEDGLSALYLLEGDRLRKLDIALGVISALEFSPDGTQLGFTLSRPDAPADAYSIALADGSLTRWTFSEVGGLDSNRFVKPERIQFPSFDGRMIPAYVFRPKPGGKDSNLSNDEPLTSNRPNSGAAAVPRNGRVTNPSYARAPVLIGIHGGPEGQYRPNFSEIDQFYLNELGIAVIRPNVRGSEGYGKTYVDLDNADKREDSVRDIGALLDWITTQPDLDPSRVAVMGASYGGYMVLASLTHYSDRLRAGVDVVGIASFRSFLENTSPYRRDLRRAEYGDDRDPRMLAFFKQIDPLNNAARIRAALLVAHGRNDPRVPFTEAQQIVPRVRANGHDVWTVYADNEGHGFARKENHDYLTAATVLFLQKHLATAAGSPGPSR